MPAPPLFLAYSRQSQLFFFLLLGLHEPFDSMFYRSRLPILFLSRSLPQSPLLNGSDKNSALFLFHGGAASSREPLFFFFLQCSTKTFPLTFSFLFFLATPRPPLSVGATPVRYPPFFPRRGKGIRPNLLFLFLSCQIQVL